MTLKSEKLALKGSKIQRRIILKTYERPLLSTVKIEFLNELFKGRYADNSILLAPKIITLVFNMVKPFLHPVTLDKISVFRFDKNEWSAALLKEIDADP